MSAFLGLLNNVFTVERRSRVSDGQGGWIIVYETVATIEGRIRPANSTERLVADSEEQQITHVLYTEADVDVARGDRVTAPDGLGDGALTVEVLGIREPSLAGHHWEIDCLERQEELTGELGS